MKNIRSYFIFLRKPIFFSVTLLAAGYIVLVLEKLKPSDFGQNSKLFEKEVKISKHKLYPLKKATTLTAQENIYAKIAWKYFENNYVESTGMVNGIDNRHYFSISDLASSLMATLSAYELGIIDSITVDKRLVKAIETIKGLKLFNNMLPNKRYHSYTLEFYPPDIKEQSTSGNGWSAIDIGRLFAVINKIKLDYPQYFILFKTGISSWKFEEMIINGYMYGTIINDDNEIEKIQEGNLGYEEYSAKGLSMLGFDVSQALEYTDFLRFVDVYDVEIAIDTREVLMIPHFNYLTSDPYIMEGLEYGWNYTSIELAYRLFLAQKSRFKETEIITACGEDFSEKAPFYFYNTIYANEKLWNCFTPNGFDAIEMKTVYTKNAFGWYVLIDDKYSNILMDHVKKLYNVKKGWYLGKYENSNTVNKAITLSTNAIILESLNYKANGKLIKF